MKIDINNIGQGPVTGEGTSVNYSFAELLTIANLRKGAYMPCSRNPVLATVSLLFPPHRGAWQRLSAYARADAQPWTGHASYRY